MKIREPEFIKHFWNAHFIAFDTSSSLLNEFSTFMNIAIKISRNRTKNNFIFAIHFRYAIRIGYTFYDFYVQIKSLG